MTRLEAQARTRDQNAALSHEPPEANPRHRARTHVRGLHAQRVPPLHVPLRRPAFSGLPRAAFLKALGAEGVPASSGYSPLNREPFLEDALATRGFPGDLPEVAAGRVARAQPVPAERSPVLRGDLAGSDDAARTAAGHGRHRRSRTEGAGACPAARAGRHGLTPPRDRNDVEPELQRSRRGHVGSAARPRG